MNTRKMGMRRTRKMRACRRTRKSGGRSVRSSTRSSEPFFPNVLPINEQFCCQQNLPTYSIGPLEQPTGRRRKIFLPECCKLGKRERKLLMDSRRAIVGGYITTQQIGEALTDHFYKLHHEQEHARTAKQKKANLAAKSKRERAIRRMENYAFLDGLPISEN